MRVLFHGINFSPELTGSGKYSGELVDWLAANGHEVRVVTAPPYYPSWRIYAGFRASSYSIRHEARIKIYRCPVYVPRDLSTLRRILHLLSFALSSLPILLRQWIWRPNLVIVVIPTLLCAPQAALLARLSGAFSIAHIQDFEVDAVFGLGMARGRFIYRLAILFERFVLRQFNLVSTISFGMLRRAQAKGVPEDCLRLLPNWSELDRFQYVNRSSALLRRVGIDPAKRVVLYSGNLGEKQGLEIIIDCATYFRDDPDVIFLIVGDGASKGRLLHLVQAKGIDNVVFVPLQPTEQLPALLASADCHLVVQRRGAADAVMPSKLTNILAVGGNAVITADTETSLGELCAEFPGIATLVEPESVEELVRGVKTAIDLPRPNRIALDYAKQNLCKEQILGRFFDEVEANLVASGRSRKE